MNAAGLLRLPGTPRTSDIGWDCSNDGRRWKLKSWRGLSKTSGGRHYEERRKQARN